MKTDRIALAVAIAALVVALAAAHIGPHTPIPRLIDGTAMCDTDTECEQLRADLCEAARDDNSDSEYCQEDK